MIRSTGKLNINIGDLRHKITIQQFTKTTDDDGYKVEKWVDIKNPWAKVENLYGKEYYAAAAVQQEKTVKFVIRYMKDLNESMRIKFGKKVVNGKEVDRVYDIKFIDNIKYANRFMEIQAMEGKS